MTNRERGGEGILLGRRGLQLVGQAEATSSANHILIPRIMDPVNHLFSSNPYQDYRTSPPALTRAPLTAQQRQTRSTTSTTSSSNSTPSTSFSTSTPTHMPIRTRTHTPMHPGTRHQGLLPQPRPYRIPPISSSNNISLSPLLSQSPSLNPSPSSSESPSPP